MAEPNGTAWGETLVSFVSFLSTVRYLVHSISRQLPGQSSQAATVSPCMQCAQTNPTANLLFPLRQATAILFLSGIPLFHIIVWLALAQTSYAYKTATSRTSIAITGVGTTFPQLCSLATIFCSNEAHGTLQFHIMLLNP